MVFRFYISIILGASAALNAQKPKRCDGRECLQESDLRREISPGVERRIQLCIFYEAAVNISKMADGAVFFWK